MRYLSRTACVVTASFFALWISVAMAAAPTKISVECKDINGSRLTCKFTPVSSPTGEKEGSLVIFDLHEPTVELEVSAKESRSRIIEINVASKKEQSPRIVVYLADELPKDQVPTVGLLGDVQADLESGNIDRAIAIIDQIDASIAASRPDIDQTGTFYTHYLYYRVAAFFQGCTRLFYYSQCDEAMDAIDNLSAAIRKLPAAFKRENIESEELDRYRSELRVADLRFTMARANWYFTLRHFGEARELFIAARELFKDGDEHFREKSRLTPAGLDKDIKSSEDGMKVETQDAQPVSSGGQVVLARHTAEC